MLQRIQTLWLLLAGVLAFLTVRLSIYSGTRVTNGINEFDQINAGSSLFLLIFTIALGLVPLIAIFLYKNRSMQIKLSLAAIGVYIVCSLLYYLKVKSFTNGTFTLWAGFYFLIPILLLLAIRGIYKDIKLVKSIDRLR
jgi:hypothetical protein